MPLDFQTHVDIPLFLDQLEKKIPNMYSAWNIADWIDNIFQKIINHNNNTYPFDIAWHINYMGSEYYQSTQSIELKILIQGYQISTKFNQDDLDDWKKQKSFKKSDLHSTLLNFHDALGEYNYEKTYSIPTKAVLSLVYENLSKNAQFPSEEICLAINILNNITTYK